MASTTPTTPTTIAGRYELQRRLAQGGMAEVWLAVDLTLDRKVAVKWLKPTLATDPIVAERFRREAIAAASLNHPNIVAVHDVFEQDGRQAVVMQLVDGKSLRQLLDTQNRLSPELTCHIGIAVARALDNAHQAGFVHRDVKPGNIMITPDGRVLLTDFGIAKGLRGDGSDDLTSDNIMMGTAKYLSPEQVRGKKLDGRADLYSLGLVLYECLAGRVPFLGETDADTALARLQRDPTDLARLRATLPTRLVGAVHALLARKPELRPPDGATLIVELEAAQADGPPDFDPTNEERSPVAPFSAGKLVRAPSDARGRALDRSRGVRRPTPPRGQRSRDGEERPDTDARRRATSPGSDGRDSPVGPALHSGPVGIIGEPPHITGRIPVQTTPSTRVATTRAGQESPPDDRTPSSGHQRGAPARGMNQNWSPSLAVVGGLVVLALVVGAVLWLTLVTGDDDGSLSTPTASPDATTVASPDDAVSDEPAAPADVDAADPNDDPAPEESIAAPVGPVQIVSVATFDPEVDGGSGDENDDQVGGLIDGDADTTWRTQCYSNRFMGAKPGVGVVVSFDGELDGELLVDFENGPFNVDFHAWSGVDLPTSIDGWGEPFDRASSDSARTAGAAAAGLGANHVLVQVLELGENTSCSNDNPFSAEISEIRIG